MLAATTMHPGEVCLGAQGGSFLSALWLRHSSSTFVDVVGCALGRRFRRMVPTRRPIRSTNRLSGRDRCLRGCRAFSMSLATAATDTFPGLLSPYLGQPPKTLTSNSNRKTHDSLQSTNARALPDTGLCLLPQVRACPVTDMRNPLRTSYYRLS